MSLSSFRRSMLDCEIYRNGVKIETYKGLVNDTKEYNMISFEPNPEPNIEIGDDIYCPVKRKHYIITNVDIRTFQGRPHSFDAYFENNFVKPISTTTFNTYNPTNSIIGNQQNAVLNINDCINNLHKQIEQNGNEDKEQLQELLDALKSETSNNQINKSAFAKFNGLLVKHGPWLIPSISQLIAAWIQRG